MAETKSCLVPSPFKQEFPRGVSLPTFENLKGQIRHEELPTFQSNLSNLDQTKTVVVMIGGLIETSTVWKRYQDKLEAAGIPWIAISLPGFDGRPESGKNFSAKNSLAAVLEKLESVGNSRQAGCTDKIKTVLIGNSLGANVAFEIAGKTIPGLEITETHLLSPAINAYDMQLKALALYYKTTEHAEGFGGKDSWHNACRNVLPIAEKALHELSIKQYMQSARARKTDAPEDVYFSVKLPLTVACEAVKMARDLEKGIVARKKTSDLKNYFIYEPSSDALLEPSGMGDYIQTKRFPKASHFIPTNQEGLELLDGIIGRIKK